MEEGRGRERKGRGGKPEGERARNRESAKIGGSAQVGKAKDVDDELRGSHADSLGRSVEAFIEDDLRTRFVNLWYLFTLFLRRHRARSGGDGEDERLGDGGMDSRQAGGSGDRVGRPEGPGGCY